MKNSFLNSIPRFINFHKIWKFILLLLLFSSCVYLFLGTPARLKQRFPNWQPEFGTLNGLDYMRQGSYTWLPTGRYKGLPEIRIELRYDWEAIQWLLENVRGNLVIVEAAETDFYLAGGTRVATMTGLSGLSGFHEFEQRYRDVVAQRNALHIEFWETPDTARTMQIIEELDIALIYVGQLESHLHPHAIEKFMQMHKAGLITLLYENEKTVIYSVPHQIFHAEDEKYYPLPERN